MENKKGGIEAIFILAAISIMVVVFFALWIFGMNIVTDTFLNIDSSQTKLNISDVASKTLEPVNEGYQTLRLIAFVIFFGLSLSFILTSFFVKAHPYLYVVYIFIVMLAVIFSVYISNAYEGLIEADLIFSSTIESFAAMTFIMSYLPLWIGTVGLIGAILLFINVTRDPEATGGIGL